MRVHWRTLAFVGGSTPRVAAVSAGRGSSDGAAGRRTGGIAVRHAGAVVLEKQARQDSTRLPEYAQASEGEEKRLAGMRRSDWRSGGRAVGRSGR